MSTNDLFRRCFLFRRLLVHQKKLELPARFRAINLDVVQAKIGTGTVYSFVVFCDAFHIKFNMSENCTYEKVYEFKPEQPI